MNVPVGHINTNDAGLQQFPVLIGAGGQQPALVVGQAVADKQDIVLLGCLTKRLPELSLFVFHWSQNEGRRIQTQTLWPLHRGKTLVSLKTTGGYNNTMSDSPHTSFRYAEKNACYLWVLECHVNGETRAKTRQSLEVGGVGQRPTTLSEHREGQRLEVLAVEVTFPTVHRLQQILAGNNLTRNKQVVIIHLVVLIFSRE